MAKPLRVLLIVNHFPPDANPSGRLMSQLADGLRARGLSVDVLTSFPHYAGFRVDPTRRGRLFERERVGDDVVTRLWVFASGRKQNMLHRLANYLSFAGMVTLAGAFTRRRHDVVLANSGSFFTGVVGWVLRVLRRTPFVYNVQDIYPDVPVRAGQLSNRRAVAALERIERFMYARAARVTVISREQRRVLIRKGVPEQKLLVSPNFVDTSFIRPLPRDNAFARAHGLADRFVVAHAGNLGYAYDFDALLACAAALRGHEDIVFLIIGEGVRKEAIEERVRTEALANVCLLDFQPEQQLPEVRAAVDVQLSLYRRGAAESSLPSKLYEIMASGRPVIVSAEAGTDARSLVEAARCGLSIEPENAEQLCAAVRRLRAEPALARELGENGRHAAVCSYSREVAAERYAALLEEVAKR
ncbi:MAG: glycosyltransferase family 4 protein [Gemmatimonadota bacterium]